MSTKFEVHPNQISKWKKEFIANASAAFETKNTKDQSEEDKEKLYTKIGHLQVEIDFYNQKRRHTEIGKIPPDQCYYKIFMAS